jgi:hypothetical protein
LSDWYNRRQSQRNVKGRSEGGMQTDDDWIWDGWLRTIW